MLAALLAGVDDVLTKPLSPAAVAQRMLRLAAARKPFVAASGYMGPIRAQMGRAFRDVSQFEAPNALKAALAGESLEDLMSDPAFEQARDRLTILRLESCTRLVAAAARGMLHAETDEERRDAVADIRKKALELRNLAPDIPEGNLNDTVRRLAALANVAAEEEDEAARNLPDFFRPVTATKPPPQRITMGYNVIAAAKEVWVLASGAAKSDALKTSLEKASNTPLGRVLKSRSATKIFTDIG